MIRHRIRKAENLENKWQLMIINMRGKRLDTIDMTYLWGSNKTS